MTEEGEPVDPKSIITLPVTDGRPVFPAFERSAQDAFLDQVHVSGKKWVIITDADEEPQLVLDADAFIRDCLFEKREINPFGYCHRPIVVKDSRLLLGQALRRLQVFHRNAADDVIEQDIILVWTAERRIISGADILGRLLQGITVQATRPALSQPGVLNGESSEG